MIVDSFRARPGLPAGGRAECRDGPRPCPYLRCKHHLWTTPAFERHGRPGRFVSLDPHTQTTCALDVAERERTLDEVAELLGVTRRRVEQIVKGALEKLRSNGVEIRTMLEGR